MSEQQKSLTQNENNPNNFEISKNKTPEEEIESPLYKNVSDLQANNNNVKMSIPIKNPSYSYLENLDKTSYLFITNKYVKFVFYILLISTIIISILSVIFFNNHILIMIMAIIIMIILFLISSIYPYGIEVRVNVQNKAIELKKKCMIQKFNIFSIKSYNIFECKEFSLLQREINDNGIVEYKINLMFMDQSEPINIFEIWGFKEEFQEYDLKCKNLNKFLGEDVRKTVLRLTQLNQKQQNNNNDSKDILV
jgi:hypothetical protein